MKNFQFKEIDHEGMQTLEAISQANHFNHWMYHTIKPYCKGNILEIGSGIGNITKEFIKSDIKITASDIRNNYCSYLSNNYDDYLNDILLLDIIDPNFDQKFKKYFGSFDTIFALNIVEHVKDDNLAIANCKKLLKKDGHLIILVPAYQALYNKFDKELEHFRRYNLKTLSKLFTDNHLEIIHRQYFNFVAILGWWFSGSVLKKKTIPEGQMKLYNSLVPIFKIIDKIVLNKIGISSIVVGKK